MRIGNKKIYHLEAWVVKVMSLYKVGSHINAAHCSHLTPFSQHFILDIDMSAFD